MDRLLDLYLVEDFPREMLTERRARLEDTSKHLREWSSLAAQIKAQTLTSEQK